MEPLFANYPTYSGLWHTNFVSIRLTSELLRALAIALLIGGHYLAGGGGTSGSAQGLLLAIHSEFNPISTQGIIWGSRD